jgi:PIN domain nuclease of toxin-antitoxin system
VRILLDTNAFIRALNGTLPSKVERRVLKSSNELLVSITTPWEIAIKQNLHRAGLTSSLVESKITEFGARLLPLTLKHIAELHRLPMHHKEPFDRVLIAQALVEDCLLVSSDARFPLYASSGLKVLWDD